MNRTWMLILGALLVGCPVVDDDDSAGDDDDSTAEQIAIPDPGSAAGATSWLPDRDISTPDIAWEGGVIEAAPSYIESDVPEGGSGAFYVFEAGSDFAFDIYLFDGAQLITDLHMHDGNGLVFGEEIAASVDVVLDNGNVTGTWEVEAGNIYVFEVLTVGAGFF